MKETKNADIKAVVKRSSLCSNVNRLLQQQSLYIKDVYIEKYVYVSEYAFRNANIVDSIPQYDKQIRYIDCSIGLSIAEIE